MTPEVALPVKLNAAPPASISWLLMPDSTAKLDTRLGYTPARTRFFNSVLLMPGLRLRTISSARCFRSWRLNPFSTYSMGFPVLAFKLKAKRTVVAAAVTAPAKDSRSKAADVLLYHSLLSIMSSCSGSEASSLTRTIPLKHCTVDALAAP